MSEMLPFVALFAMLMFASCEAQKKVDNMPMKSMEIPEGMKVAYFADACYWCTEGIWEALDGVYSVESGFVGGIKPAKPTYANHGNYAEGNRVIYDPTKITYAELVDAYFDGHSHGKSPDKGQAYRAIIFPDGEDQMRIVTRRLAQERKEYGKFKQSVRRFDQANWHIGPDSHQDYIQRLENGESVPNARYGIGESIPRRDRALKKITAEKKRKLDAEEHYIMVKKGTERPFSSPLNSEKRRGVYVSPATGDTLFHSDAKFSSGTGWPSFDDATDNVAIRRENDGSGRMEVIEKSTGYHLGHLFTGEGFTSNNKRYCINGDALEFKPDNKKQN